MLNHARFFGHFPPKPWFKVWEWTVSSSRIHLEGNTLFHEPNINLPYKKLDNIKIVPFDKKSLFFGGVNAVSRKNAVGDNRRGGVGMIIEK